MLETSASHMTALVHILCVRSTVAFSHTWCTARPNPPAGGGAQKEEKGRAHKAMGQSRAAAAGRQQRQQGDGQAGEAAYRCTARPIGLWGVFDTVIFKWLQQESVYCRDICVCWHAFLSELQVSD